MQLDRRARQTLLSAARWTIERELGKQHASFTNHDPDPALREPRASFVTLTRHSKLRGCMGTLDIEWPLLDDVLHNAHAAAFHDPRFSPLASMELKSLQISISVLSTPQPLRIANRRQLLQVLRPGIDGVILEASGRRATFLPTVWETLVAPEMFFEALLRKAGLDAHYWSSDLRFFRYSADSFYEENPQ